MITGIAVNFVHNSQIFVGINNMNLFGAIFTEAV